jgi:hypothetical protein
MFESETSEQCKKDYIEKINLDIEKSKKLSIQIDNSIVI